MVFVPEGRLIVARHEVPGKAASKEPYRRVRYDRRLIPELFLMYMDCSSTCEIPTHRTLRDGLYGGPLSKALHAWLPSHVR